jgi:hypothetical protein
MTGLMLLGCGGGSRTPDPTVVLLIGAETGILDESQYARTLTTVGNAARTTAQAKYGTASLTFDGAGDGVTAPASTDFDFGAGDFTVEGWFSLVTKTDSQAFMGKWGSGNAASNWFFFLISGKLTFRSIVGASVFDVAGTWVPTLGTWYHLAADRSGTTARVYVNGAVVATDAAYTYNINPNVQPLSLGFINPAGSVPTFDYNGQMDEIRVTKGLARYAGAFTPPSGPFPRPT